MPKQVKEKATKCFFVPGAPSRRTIGKPDFDSQVLVKKSIIETASYIQERKVYPYPLQGLSYIEC